MVGHVTDLLQACNASRSLVVHEDGEQRPTATQFVGSRVKTAMIMAWVARIKLLIILCLVIAIINKVTFKSLISTFTK